MILYTPLAIEEVLEGLTPPQTPMRTTTWMGVSVEVEPLENGRGRINRVLSTDPQKFLDPGLQPGVEIPFAYQGQS